MDEVEKIEPTLGEAEANPTAPVTVTEGEGSVAIPETPSTPEQAEYQNLQATPDPTIQAAADLKAKEDADQAAAAAPAAGSTPIDPPPAAAPAAGSTPIDPPPAAGLNLHQTITAPDAPTHTLDTLEKVRALPELAEDQVAELANGPITAFKSAEGWTMRVVHSAGQFFKTRWHR